MLGMVEGTLTPKSETTLALKDDPESLLIRKLALDCKTFMYKDPETGQKYMEKFLKRDISRRTYFRYLHELDSDPELHLWIEEQAKIGFVKNQRDMIEEVIRMKGLIMEQLQQEISKEDTIEQTISHKDGSESTFLAPNPAKNKNYITGLINQLGFYNKRLGELNLGNPIVATIKYMIDHAGEKKEIRQLEPISAGD